MTHAELGAHIKALHPQAYGRHPDELVGRAVQKKFAPLYDDVKTSGKDPDSGTVPELPRTLRIQLTQLAEGKRKAVFIPKGSKVKVNPAQYKAVLHRTAAGDVFFNPKLTSHAKIDAAFKNHELNELLGDAQAGYGAPPKQDLQPPVSAVVSRAPDGTVAHGALTDPAHKGTALAVAQHLTPPGGHASVESPDAVVAERQQPEPPVQQPDKPPSQENKPLDPDQLAVRDRFAQYVDGDTDTAAQEYEKKHGNVIVPNFARKLSPDFRKNPAKYNDAVHPAAIRLVDELFRRAITKPGPGDVIITAGGTGSGKTSALPKSGPVKDLLDHAKVVREMHFDQPEKDQAEIDAALQAGNNVLVLFVQRGAADSFFNGVVPRTEKTGVPVSISKHAETHAGARQAFDMILKAYQGNPHVKLLVIDNDKGPGKAELSDGPLAPAPPTELIKANLAQELERQAHAGKIDQTTYRAARGDADPTSPAPMARNSVAA
jgi:hypothetical protein